MAYVNQIHPLERGVRKNKEFLELLYHEQGFTRQRTRGVYKAFEMAASEGIHTRTTDSEMTLEKFLELIDSQMKIRLDIGSPDSREIVYCAHELNNAGEVDRFVFIGCPYNDNNLNIVSELYKKAFNCNLEDEPVKEELIEEYQEQVRQEIIWDCYLDKSREERG